MKFHIHHFVQELFKVDCEIEYLGGHAFIKSRTKCMTRLVEPLLVMVSVAIFIVWGEFERVLRGVINLCIYVTNSLLICPCHIAPFTILSFSQNVHIKYAYFELLRTLLDL